MSSDQSSLLEFASEVGYGNIGPQCREASMVRGELEPGLCRGNTRASESQHRTWNVAGVQEKKSINEELQPCQENVRDGPCGVRNHWGSHPRPESLHCWWQLITSTEACFQYFPELEPSALPLSSVSLWLQLHGTLECKGRV